MISSRNRVASGLLAITFAAVCVGSGSIAAAQQKQADSQRAGARVLPGESGDPSEDAPVSAAEEAPDPGIPDLAEVIPAAGVLYGRLRVLKGTVEIGVDVSAVTDKYGEIEARLKDHDAQLVQLQESSDYRYTQFLELKKVIRQERELQSTLNPSNERFKQGEGE
jgi:hypothetical protein